ncbi:MAG: MFS transporter [Planctomycetes bacterium]|jgi:POT family proton-dependent oligopeptide transporter|nr:MFS transporter [Planctomycetota bacterium]MBT6453730.1 MFS transporter [Planctomycetota bacterium]MBT6541882.1 MFS transporter [Planctomycetota bacterium]MBT6967388.1 MFS transporter [Planctomycetota bacterium]MBT7104048.1 MFS transporter [Planctomycetota bacterium]
MSSSHLSTPPLTTEIPKGIPYIIGNEAAERFSFYGMKGILVVFMTQFLFLMPGASGGDPMARATAVENYHLFTTAVYFTPIFGALIADIFLGKYLTIMALSMVYCAGHGVLALMGIHASLDPFQTLWIGLLLISLGSGGIKPCVSAHVGDQFGIKNSYLLTKAFGWFYFSINTGAFLSTLLTPWLLEWYGPHLAFGIPGILMAIATFAFWMGRNVFVHIPPGGKAWFSETFSAVGIQSMLKVSVIFIFIAVFWALFDQTGSSWVLQAQDMDRNWLGVTWLASQVQAVNPVMILILIPTFQFLVYPAIDRVWKLTPVRKISLGLFVMVGGFAMVAIAQGLIDAGETPSIGWQILAYSILTAAEVMVSITGLEFAYTQAPKRMKSVIMALFLMSVSLGNYFTAAVNHNIVVPDTIAVAVEVAAEVKDLKTEPERIKLAKKAHMTYSQGEGEGFILLLPGFSVEDPADDIRVQFNNSGSKSGLVLAETAILEQGLGLIDQYWQQNDRLPLTSDGGGIVGALKDPWENPLRYQLINRQNFVISSDGPDGLQHTPFDAWIGVEVASLSVAAQEEAVMRQSVTDADATPRYSWIERRKAQIELEKASGSEGAGTLSVEDFLPVRTSIVAANIAVQPFKGDALAHVGGATTLQGAPYFWFFTQLMLATAFVFMGVAYFYKPKDYIQGEDAPPGKQTPEKQMKQMPE